MFDDRYGYPKYFDIVRCETCGLFETLPPLEEKDIENLYTRYYTRTGIDPAKIQKNFPPINQLALWWEGNHRLHYGLPRGNGEKVLKIGCGDGKSLLFLKARGYEPHGIETDRNVAKVRDALGLSIHIGTIETAPFPEKTFDIIIANQLIEHILDLDSFLEHAKKMLKENGVFLVSTPNGESAYRKILGRKWVHWHIPYHQQIFSKKSMRAILLRHGFILARAKTVTPLSWTLHNIHSWRAPVSEYGKPNPYWVKPVNTEGKAPAKKKTMRQKAKRGIFTLGAFCINAFNRFIDFSGQGDCLIVYISKKS